jgi:hypothetical protein
MYWNYKINDKTANKKFICKINLESAKKEDKSEKKI